MITVTSNIIQKVKDKHINNGVDVPTCFQALKKCHLRVVGSHLKLQSRQNLDP